MATRTSSRSTKAVKFVDAAESDTNEDFDPSAPVRRANERKKVRARTNAARRKRNDDDEEWDASNEQIEQEEDDDDDEEEGEDENEEAIPTGDPNKKFKGNQSMDSVYDFGDASRKWPKSTPQRSRLPSKTNVTDSGKSGEKLMCSYCNYTTTKKYLLQRHLKSHSTERPHKCAYCERSFKTTIQLTNHVNTHLGVKPFQCKFCSFSFTTSGELIRHVRYKHTLEKPHRCDQCGYATVELSKLRRHIRTHTGEKPYACPHCSYCSPDTFKLKRHLRVHTGERPYQCNICNFRFTQSNSLKAHMLTHQADKPSFPCSFCPSVMARKSDLRYHIGKQHARQAQPLSCNKCDEDFPDKYSLRMHGKTHKGQTIHSCNHCEFSANTSQQLEDHLNKHRGNQPFQCSECGLMFAARADLRAHVTRTHRTPLNPSINVNSSTARPQRRAASLQNRYIGMSSGPEDEDQGQQDEYRCLICNRQFTSARLLDRHTFAVHEPKHDSYDEMVDHRHPDEQEEDDDVRDYADDELEENEKERNRSKIKSEQDPLETVIYEPHEPEDIEADEENDVASNVEDILDDQDEEQFENSFPTIKSTSTGHVRKQEEQISNDLSRNYNANRVPLNSNADGKNEFDVFSFDG